LWVPLVVLLGGIALLGVLVFSGSGWFERLAETYPPEGPVGIVLISLDTLRADHLGLYGYQRPTSPNIDRWARQAIVFRNEVVQLPGTLPSHMSMMTSLYPREHGVLPLQDGVIRLSDSIRTVAELLKERGFRTAGYTDGGYVSAIYGFERGFDEFRDDFRRWPDVVAAGTEFLGSVGPEEPFFLFLHTYEIHDPYRPPEKYKRMFLAPGQEPPFEPLAKNLVRVNRGEIQITGADVEALKGLYDASIRYVDDLFPRILEALEERGLARRTMVILTSDHGEEFLEHGGLVHEQVYDPTLRVPLIIDVPGWPGKREFAELTETVDLMPTILGYAGVPVPEQARGQDLLKLVLGTDAAPGARRAYTQSHDDVVRCLHRWFGNRLMKLMVRELRRDQGGLWIERDAVLSTVGSRVELVMKAYREPREVEVFQDDELLATFTVPVETTRFELDLGGGEQSVHVLRLITDGCARPKDFGESADERCLSVLVSRTPSVPLALVELYDLTADKLERNNLVAEEPEILAAMGEQLAQEIAEQKPWETGERLDMSDEQRERLIALGYLQ
jgi:arylsulfatase A-like enzyme